MNIVIRKTVMCKEIIDSLIQENDGIHVKGYRIMEPAYTVPRCTLAEVIADFNSLPGGIKKEIRATGMLCVYVEGYAKKAYTTSWGYDVDEGECVGTDEAFIYNFATNSWND